MQSPDFENIIELKGSVIFFRNDGIIVIEIRSDIYFEEDDAVDIARSLEIHCADKRCLTVIRLGKYTNMDKDAREYLASEDRSKYSSADAIVAADYAGKLVANFYINFHKPVRPTMVFDTDHEAISWLKKFKR